jgi:hypothetical protein
VLSHHGADIKTGADLGDMHNQHDEPGRLDACLQKLYEIRVRIDNRDNRLSSHAP